MAEELALPRSLRAPAKLNLGLRVGPADESGLHAVRSLFCPLELSDRLTVHEADHDEVVCPAVADPNLAASALAGLRDAGWRAPPVRIEIEKRIPVAAGLGGGSADAAAVLRLASNSVAGLEQLAFELGSDVPSQLRPAPCIVAGRGELIAPVALSSDAGVVLIGGERPLRAGDVYAKADEIGCLAPTERELDAWESGVRAELSQGASPPALAGLIVNDLEPAARALAPEIDEAVCALHDVGAAAAFVCGSGPTVAGLFADLPAADAAAAQLGPRHAGALVTALDTRGTL